MKPVVILNGNEYGGKACDFSKSLWLFMYFANAKTMNHRLLTNGLNLPQISALIGSVL